MGVELLSAGGSRRPDSSRPRGAEGIVLRLLLRLVAAAGRTRPDDRQGDRSPRWARCAGAVEPRTGRRARMAGIGPRARRARRRLGTARDRHGARSLRLRLRDPDGTLWARGAGADHRHHLDRRLCQHRRLAVVGIARPKFRLARRLPRLGGTQPRRLPADEPVLDPATRWSRPVLRF